MSQPEGLEARVVALEGTVADLVERVRHSERDAAATRVLVVGVDRKFTEIRDELRSFRQATTASFNAMRADLTDLRTQGETLRTQVENGFASIRGTLDAQAAGQQRIVDLLNTLVTEQDGRRSNE